ncbi:hypothetical protein [Streptomyces halobius]|uniref:Uncharacterized protein n=1 Tax=Streptomyces halobius TaxID=2879846 RepID=A0ABY4MK90_9ACTN|nr:hypothetical protein [Streptomyces halobius]UQA98183.1 hypothetical protein K9S39_09950 [Streptomyces halobius]
MGSASATGDYTELRDSTSGTRLTSSPNDTTATEHRAPTPGGQFYAKSHGIYVNPDTPLALRVAHNDCAPRNVVLAEFNLCIHPAAGPAL